MNTEKQYKKIAEYEAKLNALEKTGCEDNCKQVLERKRKKELWTWIAFILAFIFWFVMGFQTALITLK
jgi:predicted nucleic acid-binding Zn ribbon protein